MYVKYRLLVASSLVFLRAKKLNELGVYLSK